MYWSASLALRTGINQPKAKPNYGSIRPKSTSAIRIPESIPEHQSVCYYLPFQHRNLPAREHDPLVDKNPSKPTFDGLNAHKNIALTASATFKLLLLQRTRKEVSEATTFANQAVESDAPQLASPNNYWMQERERQRARGQIAPARVCTSVRSTSSAQGVRSGRWSAVTIMCSVPLAFVVLFIVLVMIANGGDNEAIPAVAFSSKAHLRGAR